VDNGDALLERAHGAARCVNNPRALRILPYSILKRAARCILAEDDHF
jgi:hypothetical protein